MGLISTIGNLGTTAVNIGQGIEDLIGAAKNSIFGMQDNVKQENPMSGYSTIKQNWFEPSKFFDLRGRRCVFRGKENTYNTNSFKTHFDMDSDFYWYDSAFQGQLWDQIKPKIQKIYIHEFQPYQQSFLGQLVSFTNWLSGKINQGNNRQRLRDSWRADENNFNTEMQRGLGTEATTTVDIEHTTYAQSVQQARQQQRQQFITDILQLGSQMFKDTSIIKSVGNMLGNQAIRLYSKEPHKLYDRDGITSHVALINPTAAVNKMFLDGVWLHTYTIPLINRQMFKLISSSKMYGDLKGGGGELASLSETFSAGKKQDGSNFDKNNMFSTLPSTPKFTPNLQARNQITTDFYLINKNSVYLTRNYRFLTAFAVGTMPVQLPFGKMHPPNVYYVEIPGKREFVWAQITVDVQQVGKYRADDYATEQIYQETGSKAIKFIKRPNGYYNNKILWPEAWHVTVKIMDFTPNTFNTFEHYLTYGSSLTDLKTNGGFGQDFSQAIITARNNISGLFQQAVGDDNLSEIGQ